MSPTSEEENAVRRNVDQFILGEIDSVPHLEALLLLWNSRPRVWTVEELAHDLYIPVERTREIAHDLQQRGMLVSHSDQYSYNSGHSYDALIADVDRFYRRDLIRISRMIHSKASPAVREFARAFRLKKD